MYFFIPFIIPLGILTELYFVLFGIGNKENEHSFTAHEIETVVSLPVTSLVAV